MGGAIAQDRQRCQFPFVVDEKPTFVPGGSAGEQSGGAQEVPCGAARSNSGRAAPSACVGKRFSAAQIIWNRSTRRAGARGGARVGRPRWLTSALQLRAGRQFRRNRHRDEEVAGENVVE